jgi:hypothetical protein
MLMRDNAAEGGEVLRELRSPDRFRGAGEVPTPIANREADRLGADVQSGELAAIGKRSGEVAHVGGDH